MLQLALSDLAAQYGLMGGVYVHLGHAIHANRREGPVTPPRFVASSSPDRRLYLEEGALAFDPAVRRCATAHMPYVWTAAADDDADTGRLWLARRLQDRGVYGGVAVPVQDYAAGPAYISLYGAFIDDVERLVATRGPDLAYSAAAFHQDAKAKLPPYGHTAVRAALTGREMGCLRLAALGHTVSESAEVLQVTARTVEFHLKNAADKLGASSKLRAVALAMGCGLIAI